jgi:fused signal recognition particle receptor
VLDGTAGQNALSQARLFSEAAAVTGIVLTKLDGSAKGGTILAIANEMRIPIKLIGIGERMTDLRDFDPELFVEALFGQRTEAEVSKKQRE